MKETFVLGEEDLGALAEKVVNRLADKSKNDATVILLEGDLGAGKTTFTKSLAAHLGIDSHQVHSPTFILKKEYGTAHGRFRKLVHIDAYRFNHPDEAKVLRLEDDLADSNSLIVIEWPSKMMYLKSDMELAFEVEDERARVITMKYE